MTLATTRIELVLSIRAFALNTRHFLLGKYVDTLLVNLIEIKNRGFVFVVGRYINEARIKFHL